MVCEKVLGTVADAGFAGCAVDYVDFEWYEAFARLHRKLSRKGEDLRIRLEPEAVKTGLRQGDVLYAGDLQVIAVNILPCEAIRAVVCKDHPEQIAKLCYEVGNTHTSMFRGEDMYTFYLPFSGAMLDKINRLHGVSGEKTTIKFDFDRALSSSVNNHHH